MVPDMAEQASDVRREAWERLMAAIRDAASDADPEEVEHLARTYELLNR